MSKEEMTAPEDREIIEQLAAIEHERWSDWHKHTLIHSTPSNRLRWERQAHTIYEELSEREKESDRKEVRRYWPIIQKHISEARRQERIKVLESDEIKNIMCYANHSQFCDSLGGQGGLYCSCGFGKAYETFNKLKQEGQ